jgi:cytochrome c oxidase subunit IV
MEHNDHHMEHTEAPKDMKSKIWRTFWILTALTVVDIALYFMLLENHSMLKNVLFIALGVIKAYYIIGIFMHMKFEQKWLGNLIIYPMIFVVFLVALMIIESNYTALIR